jgi:MFS family permease
MARLGHFLPPSSEAARLLANQARPTDIRVMTNASAEDNARGSEPFYTGGRIFGLLIGGLFAPFIGDLGARAADAFFPESQGSNDASPQAFAEALWGCGLIAFSMLSVWLLLAAVRRFAGSGPRNVLATLFCLAIAVLVLILDVLDRGFDGPPDLSDGMTLVFALIWIISIMTAFALGSVAIATTYTFSKPSVVSLVASGAVVAFVVSVLFPGTPLFMVGDGFVRALGFWLPTGVFTMGCCAAASGAPFFLKVKAHSETGA